MAKKILIADDEPDVLSILEKKLQQKEFEVLALSRAADIRLQAQKFKPDLVILDISMPDIDGYEAAAALRKDNKKTPIIFMTGKDLECSGIAARARKLGMCDFLSKPCTFDDLMEKIAEAITAGGQDAP